MNYLQQSAAELIDVNFSSNSALKSRWFLNLIWKEKEMEQHGHLRNQDQRFKWKCQGRLGWLKVMQEWSPSKKVEGSSGNS